MRLSLVRLVRSRSGIVLGLLGMLLSGCDKSSRSFDMRPARSPAPPSAERGFWAEGETAPIDCGVLESSRSPHAVADDIVMEILPGDRPFESDSSRLLYSVSQTSSATRVVARIPQGKFVFEISPHDQGSRVSIGCFAGGVRSELPLQRTILEGFHEEISNFSGKPGMVTVQGNRAEVLAAAAAALFDEHEVVGFCDSTFGFVAADGAPWPTYMSLPLVWVRQIGNACEVRVYATRWGQRAGLARRIQERLQSQVLAHRRGPEQ